MKVSFFDSKLLINALDDAVFIVPSTAVSVSLRSIHIKADKDAERLDISANGKGVSIRRTIWGPQATIEESGECFLPGHELLAVLKHGNADDVVFESTKEHRVNITVGKAEYELAGLDPKMFAPYKGGFEHDTVATVKAKALRQLINRTAYAASRVETRPILTGINLVATDASLKASSTDGQRLAQHAVEATVSGCKNITIPCAAFAQLACLLPNDDDEEVTVKIAERALSVSWDDDAIRFSIRSLTGVYPDLSKIIQTLRDAKWIKINCQEMLDACERIGVISDAKLEMHFGFGGVIHLRPVCQPIRAVDEQVRIIEDTDIEKEPMLFNGEYWCDLLRSLGEGETTVQVAIIGQHQPVGVKVEDTGLAIICPMVYVPR